MERLLPSRWVEWLASRVERAGGNLGSFEPSAVLALRLIATLFGVLLGFVFLAGTGFGMLGIAAAAIMVPLGLGGVDLLLHSRAGARRKLAEAELPTILDLLSLSMGAGMAFEMALKTILHRLHGPLASELRRYAVDVEALGAPRDKALLGVAYRLGGAPDVFAFVEAINAAHLLGTGLLVAVGSQATLLRQNRRRRAAASAQRAPVRMLIPMTLFMLPTLMMVVLAPVALRLTGAAQ
ncbi:MAG: type II secretion system F family protein [Chloroflexota bacterium]|nr:type II secretion system F family protein [Chloroflexota bacterium]